MIVGTLVVHVLYSCFTILPTKTEIIETELVNGYWIKNHSQGGK